MVGRGDDHHGNPAHEALSQRVVIGQGISEQEPLTKTDSLGESYRGGLWASGGGGGEENGCERVEEEGMRRPAWPALPFAKYQTRLKEASHSFDQRPSATAMQKGQY